jgi:cytochrome c oxidase subunit 2
MKRISIVLVTLIAMITLTQLGIAQEPPRVVEIAAKRFEFTPKQITLERGKPVTIRLTSSDRAHGLLVKELGIDLDADSGSPSEITITPEVAGTYPAICDHYCGSGHGNMKMTIVVE